MPVSVNLFLQLCIADKNAIFKLSFFTNTQRDFKTDVQCHLRPVVDLNAKLVILGDFNIQIECVNSQFVHFMETLFSCVSTY